MDIQSFTTQLAEDAAALAMSLFGKVRPELKPDESIVTEADRAVEKFIRDKILETYPSSAFVGEEGTSDPHGDPMWVVDPIDGSDMYAVGAPTWCVSIAVFRDAKPEAAAVASPATCETFHLSEGKVCVNGKPVFPRSFVDRKTTLLYTPSSLHRDYRAENYRGKTRNLGSACLHICYVAAGRGDAYVTRSFPWDVAPAFVLMPRIGGRITALNCQDVEWSDVIKTPAHKTDEPLLFSSCERSARFFCNHLSYTKR